MTENVVAKTGIVFGVFDGLHEGHRHFLSEAKGMCDRLVAVVTLSETAQAMKGRAPRFSYEDRVAALLAFDPSLEIVPSDRVPGAWSVFRGREPFIVMLGYDQEGIARELAKMNIPFTHLSAHHPHKYKSSILHG
jgi:cytidyltransferase-like protein